MNKYLKKWDSNAKKTPSSKKMLSFLRPESMENSLMTKRQIESLIPYKSLVRTPENETVMFLGLEGDIVTLSAPANYGVGHTYKIEELKDYKIEQARKY